MLHHSQLHFCLHNFTSLHWLSTNQTAPPTLFRFGRQGRPALCSDRQRLSSIMHSLLLNQRVMGGNLLLGGGILMKGLINGCHKPLKWTLPLVSSTPHSLKNKCWDAAAVEAASYASSSSSSFNKQAAVKHIYLQVFPPLPGSSTAVSSSIHVLTGHLKPIFHI